MSDFKPDTPYNTPFFLLIPSIVTIKGVSKKVFKKKDEVFYCSFRTFRGTQKVVNDIVAIEDTAKIETYYDPEITAGCGIEVDNMQYEILGTPENIKRQNKYMTFNVRAIKGST